MGLFSRRLETRDGSLENANVPISSEQIVSLLGGGLATDSGEQVNEFSAYRLGVFWRCVQLVSGIIASLPLNPYMGIRDAPGPKHLGPSDSILYRPPDGMTMYEYKETLAVHLLTWGNAYVRKIWNNAGDEVVKTILYRPWEVSVTRPSPGAPKVYRVTNGPQNLTDDDIMHIPGLGYDGVSGLSPVGYARQSIGLGIAVERYGAKFFGSGALLGGILKSKDRIPQDKAEQLKNRFRDKIVGLARAHEIAVLDSGVDYQQISLPPDEAQFLQTRQFTVQEVARWFGIPPHLVGDVDKTTSWGAGIAEQTLGFVRFTINFWVARIEQRFDQCLPKIPPQYAAFDMDRLLRGDAMQRASFYASAVNVGWMNRNQVRAAENLEPGPSELDEYMTPTAEAIAAATAKGLINPDGSPIAPPAPPVQPQAQPVNEPPAPKKRPRAGASSATE